MSKEEKQTILREAVKIINGRVPVILNIAEQTTEAAIAFANDAKTNGADGLMLLLPMRYAADNLETVSYFKAVAIKNEQI